MKYVVRAAGLYHGADFFAYGEGFPASLKGFDYKDALERKLIEESNDGVISDREPKEANRSRVQKSTSDGDDNA